MFKRFKSEVTQEDLESMDTPFWTTRMLVALLAVYRWLVVAGALVMVVLAGSLWGSLYWLAFTVLAVVYLRVSPLAWLQRLFAPLSRLLSRW